MVIGFKVDIGGSYGGPRWIPPPFKSGLVPVENAGVDARVFGADPSGKITKLAPVWTASDPSHVVVSDTHPGEHDYVRLEIRRAGESVVTVSSALGAITLRVRATYATGTAMAIEIDRLPSGGRT